MKNNNFSSRSNEIYRNLGVTGTARSAEDLLSRVVQFRLGRGNSAHCHVGSRDVRNLHGRALSIDQPPRVERSRE